MSDMNELYQGGVSAEETSFEKLSRAVASNVAKVAQNASSLSKLANQLTTAQESQELRNQIRQIQTYTQQMAKETSHMLMELMKIPVTSTMEKLNRERLNDDFLLALQNFQKTQTLIASKSKEDIMKSKPTVVKINPPRPQNKPSRNAVLLELESSFGKTSDTQNQEQLTMQSEQDLQELEQREREIRELEDDIRDVNDIFKELATMVLDQGGVVDSIESHVWNTHADVEAATQELRQASSYKNKLRKKKVYLAIILAIVIAIILIIVFNH